MAGWTNRFKLRCNQYVFQRTTMPTNYYIALCTSATAPTADTNLLGDLTQIATGNGYTDGGYLITPGTTDFPSADDTESDASDYGSIKAKDIPWTASVGPIPASGSGARWAVLTDDNGTVASREVYLYWDLQSDRSVSAGQDLTLQDLEIRISET